MIRALMSKIYNNNTIWIIFGFIICLIRPFFLKPPFIEKKPELIGLFGVFLIGILGVFCMCIYHYFTTRKTEKWRKYFESESLATFNIKYIPLQNTYMGFLLFFAAGMGDIIANYILNRINYEWEFLFSISLGIFTGIKIALVFFKKQLEKYLST